MTGEAAVFGAIEFAARAHAGQFRKGTRLPYIIHPLSVARILIELGQPEEVVVAGMLHDTVEDTEVSLAEIEAAFGRQVAELVGAVTEADKSDSWDARKQRTVETIRAASLPVVTLELADKLDNIRAISADHAREGDGVWQRFNSPMESQRWYYRALVVAFAERLRDGPEAGLVRAFRAEVERVFGEG